MIYRRTYQNNIYYPDRFKETLDHADRLQEETFQIDTIALYTSDGVYYANDTIATEVIESFNYFTIKYKLRRMLSIKYGCVSKVEFELSHSNNVTEEI